jgi:RNA polymerase sigma-70 factor (ECF subfamily)
LSVSDRATEYPENTVLERRLLSRYQAGDAEAMNTLFELHVDRVFAYARHLLGSREDAEEVTSEAFLRAFEKASAFRGECPWRGWLFGITKNLCMDRIRQPRLLLLEPEEVSRSSDLGAQAASMETSLLIRTMLDELEESQRMALLLCDVEQWDAKEAAAVMGKSVSATKSLLYRARRSMKAMLTEHWSDTEAEENRDEM